MTSNPESASGSDVAVVGMAGRFPGANTLAQFWENLRNGVESIRAFRDDELLAAGESESLIADPDYVKARPVLEQADMFDAGFFGFSPQDAAIMDPQHRVFLEVGWEALENAGYDPGRFTGNVGVFATCGMNTYMMYHLVTNQRIMRTVGEWLVRHTGNDMNFLATRLSYELDLKGPSMNVQTACSSALVGIHLACQSLLNGECDMAIAGGSVIALPQDRGYVYKPGEILSPDGHCRAFDARAQGTLFGSGAGLVVLRRLSDAMADGDQILAVIKGSAVNNDGSMKVGYLAPSVEGQSRAVIEALEISGIHPDTVSYIEAHGTGTLVGDPIEIAALTDAYRKYTGKTRFCAIGSLKTNIGHLGEVAGVAGLVKTVLSLQHRQIPPSLHYTSPNPQVDFESSPFFVNASLRDWISPEAPRRAGVTSLGAGGTNCHVILEEAPDRGQSSHSRPVQLLVFSAKTSTALDSAVERLATSLEETPAVSLADVAYTLQVGRKQFAHRRAFVCRDREDALTALRSGTRALAGHGEAKPHPVVFMFPGQGAQYVGMARGLYEHEPVFREEVDRCFQLLDARVSRELREAIHPATDPGGSPRLNQTAFTQPALFVIEYALARLWMGWGVQPQAMIGHSIGEYVAACLSGVFSLPDALSLVTARGALMGSSLPGAMLSIRRSADETARALAGTSLSLAASNGPSSSVVSGPENAVAAFEAEMFAQGIECQRLQTSHAFHSAMMDPILERFAETARRVAFHAPSTPYISCLTGDWIRPDDAISPAYWVSHLRNTVRFSEGLATILRTPGQVLLEVGPGRTLSSLARQQAAKPLSIVSSLRHPNEEVEDVSFVLGALGRLWAVGLQPDWFAFHSTERRHRVSLPTYPFERQRYWVEAGNPAAIAEVTPQATDERQDDITNWFYVPSWRHTAPPRPSANPPAGDLLIFADETGLGLDVAKRVRPSHSSNDPIVPVRLEFPTPGDAEVTRLTPFQRRPPGATEVEIQVKTAALNFADVLRVTGLQPEAPFGMECAGVVAATGSGVTALAPGDEVMAIGPGSFASHVTRDARFVQRKPAGLSWQDAATIPAAFMTAAYALEHVGRLAGGERILIHAASGGVGLAAVQIALQRGAEVFATAGNPEKRAYLESLGIRHVFHSRNVDFAAAVNERTGGAGVDVVLNSLTGDVVPASLRLLARQGRFLEIGKKEIYSHDQLEALELRERVSYHPIDLTQILRDDPDLYGRLLADVVSRIERQEWRPLPSHFFPVADAAQAFRLMADARHIGKVVLSFDATAPRVYIVTPGERFARLAHDRFVINPANAGDYVALFEQLGDPTELHRILHLWNVDDGAAKRSVEAQLDRSFFSPLYIAQAIGRQEANQPIDFTIVSSGVHQVSGEAAVEPGKAPLLGPCRVIPREFPNVTCRNVDVVLAAPDWQRSRLAEQLAAEIDAPCADAIVAYRGASRWAQAFEQQPLGEPSGHVLRDGGVYLITGGLGALGFEVAGNLARTVKAKLILVGRKPFPARRDWADWLATHHDTDSVAARIRRIQEWEAQGAEVLVVSADVASRDQMRAALDEAGQRFGDVHGVFHVAGTLDDGLMQLKTERSVRDVLRPKIEGTLVLDELFSNRPLDFIVVFSSISSILGLQGQVDYTAANAFVDGYAQCKATVGPTRVVSINWSAWQEIGIAAEASRARHDSRRPGAAVRRHPWLERVRHGSNGDVIFTTSFNRSRHWVIGEHVIKGSDAILPGTAYLELVRAALVDEQQKRAIEMTNVFFQSPFVVGANESKELSVLLEPSGSGFAVTFQSLSGTHAVGRAAFKDEASEPRLDVAAIARRCNLREDAPRGFLQQDFMAFGRRWANVERVQYGDAEALVTLALPPEFAADLEHIQLHPALLDMATGGAQQLIPGFNPAHDFYVPFSYGRLCFYKALPSRVLSHVRLREGGGHGPAFFDMTLVDEAGEILVDITSFCMSRVANRLNLVPEPDGSRIQPPRPAVSPELSGELADEMLRLGIRPGEGLRALDRILNSSIAPCIVVSPVDLRSLMTRVDKQMRTVSDIAAPKATRQPDTAVAKTPAAPASGDTEARLAQIWSEILGVASVGPNDNFFDLGGHSLLAVRLLTRIEKTFHKSVPLQSLFQGTMGSLALLIRGDEERPQKSSVIVPLAEQSEGPAFYCVHALAGEVLSFVSLAKALGPGQRLYAFQAPLNEDIPELARSIESIAARYVRELIEVQPKGPYFLGGWSAGSSIALEMAQQLRGTGRTVDLLVAFDGAPFNTGAGTHPWNPAYGLKLLRNLPLWIADDLIPAFSVTTFARRVRNKARAVVGAGTSALLGRENADGNQVAGFLEMSHWSLPERQLMSLLYGALTRYVPKPYPGRVLVYQSRTEPLYHLFEIDRVWRRLAPDTTVVRVAGTHVSLIHERHVSALAHDLKLRLARALDEHASATAFDDR